MNARRTKPLTQHLIDLADRYRRPIFVGIALLYMGAFNGQTIIGNDASLYLGLGENLAAGRGYTFQGVAHGLAYPGWPWALAVLSRVFGAYHLLAAHVAVLAAAGAVLALTYRTIALRLDRGTAVVVVTLLALCETFFRYAYYLLTDMPFLLGVMAVLAGYEGLRRGKGPRGRGAEGPRDQAGEASGNEMSNPIRCLSFSSSFLFPWPLLLDWALIVAGMVTFTFTRPTMWVIHAAILTAMLYHTLRGPRRMVHATVGLLSIATLLAFFVLDPRHEQPLIPPPAAATISVPAAHTAQDRPGQEKTRAGESAGISRAAPGIAYESRLGRRLDDGPVNLLRGSISSHLPDLTVGGLAAEAMLQIELGLESLNAAFALWLFAAGLALTRWRLLWGLLVLATLAQLLLFDPIPRYFVPILPLLWLGLWASLAWAASRLWRRRWWPVWAALLLLLILPNLVLTARFLRDQNTRPLWAHDQGEYVAVVAMADQLDQLTPPDARILAEDGRALTWLSQRIALGSAAVARYPAEHVQQWLANQPAVYAVLIHRGGEVHGATSHLLDQMHATIGPALTVCTGPGQTLTLHRIRPASDADPP